MFWSTFPCRSFLNPGTLKSLMSLLFCLFLFLSFQLDLNAIDLEQNVCVSTGKHSFLFLAWLPWPFACRSSRLLDAKIKGTHNWMIGVRFILTLSVASPWWPNVFNSRITGEFGMFLWCEDAHAGTFWRIQSVGGKHLFGEFSRNERKKGTTWKNSEAKRMEWLKMLFHVCWDDGWSVEVGTL